MANAKVTSRSGLGRASDYLFGRNTLIGVASLMLLAISGFATWSGMSDFILGVSTSSVSAGRQIPGGLSVTNEFLVITIVVALTFLMWLALRETFGVRRLWRDRLITFPLYLFLALWSVGFGYGFWWSLIAGEEATRSSLSGLKEDARDAGIVVAARLDAVRIQLDNVVSWSESQMAREEASGGSCGVSSGAGRGPLYNARRSVRDGVASLRDGIALSWLGPVKVDLDQLRLSAARLEGTTVAERQQRFEAMASDIRGRARSIAARSNALGKSTASEMNALADTVSVLPGEAGFSCYDPTLAQRLRQAGAQSAEPARLQLREARFSEGAAGVANAVQNLWTNIGGYLSRLVRFVLSGGKDTGGTTSDGDPISGRDLIALLATLGVDLGIFALTALNPPAAIPLQHDASLIRQIEDAIKTAIARAPGADLEWVRRHFIHHNTASYLIIPNLYSADARDEDEASKAIAMNQLAGVLDDLNLVRWPWKSEMRKLRREEKLDSDTYLARIRKERREEAEHQGTKTGEKSASGADDDLVRNHGLFSKAVRLLDIAGWSEKAKRDFEIFRLVDTEGLTPLLTVLNEAALSGTSSNEAGGDAKASIAAPAAKPMLEDKRDG